MTKTSDFEKGPSHDLYHRQFAKYLWRLIFTFFDFESNKGLVGIALIKRMYQKYGTEWLSLVTSPKWACTWNAMQCTDRYLEGKSFIRQVKHFSHDYFQKKNQKSKSKILLPIAYDFKSGLRPFCKTSVMILHSKMTLWTHITDVW